MAAALLLLSTGWVLRHLDNPTLGANPIEWRIGDRVSYEGPDGNFVFQVQGVERVLARDGTPVETLAIERTGPAWYHNDTAFVETAGWGIALEKNHCGIRERNECLSFSLLDWTIEGWPALLGSSMLIGRTLSIGDRWTVVPLCDACNITIDAEVKERSSTSLPETQATVEFVIKKLIAPVGIFRGEFQMGSDPYPLLVELNGKQYTRRSYEAGPEPLVTSGGSLPSRTSPLQAKPFESGRPVEGARFEEYPTWAEARESSGAADSGFQIKRCAAWEYRVSPRSFESDILPSRSANEYHLKETCETQDGSWMILAYDGVWPYGQTPLADVLGISWTHEVIPTVAPATADCAAAAPPFWDVVRFLTKEQLIDGLLFYRSHGTCEQHILTIAGLPPGSGDTTSGPAPSVDLDFSSGLLRFAMVESRRA